MPYGDIGNTMNKASVGEPVDRSHNFYSILYRIKSRLMLKIENSIFNIKDVNRVISKIDLALPNFARQNLGG